MRKLYPVFITASLFIIACTTYFFYSKENYQHRVSFDVPISEEEHDGKLERDEEEKEGYDGPEQAAQLEFERQRILHWALFPTIVLLMRSIMQKLLNKIQEHE